MPQTADQELKKLGIGRKIRLLREKRNLTAADLAERAGITPVLLKQIESDVVPPTLGTLLNLAGALGEGIDHFFTGLKPLEKIEHVPASERLQVKGSRKSQSPRLPYSYESLAWRLKDKHMEPFVIHFHPDSLEQIAPTTHEGEEFLFVLEGVVHFEAEDREIDLAPGDSLYFHSEIPHRVRAKGPGAARALAVLLPKSD